ncbi:MAG: hypothetical protein MJZ30_03275 [Paludibacteraceae bacterium]|nr:hypothetical protein [Paludibacteraceae bacterium]
MTQAISTYQMQILDCISQVKDEEELKEIRNLLADYFSKKALDAMDLLCEKGALDTTTIEDWSREHLRTPYKY